ncbi:MAG: putative membrane protein [Planctomycetota bacterium]|jgi:putative membrane protein
MDYPLVNACLNGSAAVLLVVGYRYIRAGKEETHATLMRLAFLVSAVFLANYLYYHVKVLPLQGGPTPYNETGVKKGLYLFLLITHVVLAVVNLPMVLRVLWLAHKQDWPRHKRWARWTFPIWLYVSITGVLVYLVLYQWNPLPAIQ